MITGSKSNIKLSIKFADALLLCVIFVELFYQHANEADHETVSLDDGN